MFNNHFNMLSALLRLNWDVFLSFRGDDTRHSVIHSLYDSLTEHGIRVFQDDVGIGQEDETASTLLDAIEDSAAYIIVISGRYADSHRCLEELSRICELKRLMLPVFYEVDPSHVRRQKGHFEHGFTSHVKRFGEDKVKEWRKSMEKLGGISGLVFDGSNEDELIQRSVNRVLRELKRTVGLPTFIVGLDSPTEILMKLLNVKSKGIQVLGLHGMGGIGKTTLAKALYNKLINHFELRCFISSVREIAEEEGDLISLQNKLLGCLFPGEPPVRDIDAGISVIRRKLYDKRVLAVIDDVDNLNQLRVVAGSRDWFGEGSRIIITTRDKEVLPKHVVNETYEVSELPEPEALQLFSHHALTRKKPTDDYLNLSEQFVSLTGRLPLALEVFGGYLFHKRTLREWEDALRMLQQSRPHGLQAVLRITFDGLDEVERTVFLDIACLFVKLEMKREEAIDILKGCGFLAETALNVLIAKSLIKIRENGTLWMHDQLRDMGREIVSHENLADPGTHSRLWDYNKIMTVLRQKKGTRYVQGIILDFRKKKFVEEDRSVDPIIYNSFVTAFGLTSAILFLKDKWMRLPCFLQETEKELEGILDTKSFESMVNLRLLQINHAKLQGKFKFFPTELKWLQWKECPLKNLPSDYDPSQLAVLDLSESGIEQVWSWRSNKVPEKLMVMNLRNCYNLAAIPDLAGCRSLEKLDLERCRRLTKIHKSLGNLSTLQSLNLQECTDLVEFPSEVSGLKCLQTLNLSGCSKLKELPKDVGSMSSLKKLLVDRTAISKLPESTCLLSKLEKLSMNGCQLIERLPDCLGDLNSLKELSLNQTSLQELPDSVGSLSNLEKLSLMWCKLLARIPKSIGKLDSLIKLFVNHTAIEEFPSSIGLLSYLKILSAGGCHSLRKLPDTIDGLHSISELDLNASSIACLPDQIGNLKTIEMLYMQNCKSITTLPEAFGSMSSLTTLNLSGSSIIELPESIGILENLTMLNLNQCRELQKIPASLGNLNSLHHLLIEKTAVTELPESFGKLSNLMILKMRKQPIKSFGTGEQSIVLPTSFPNLSKLEELDARAWRISGKIPNDFEKLSKLEILDLGYNKFSSLPASLRGLSLLKKLHLPRCEELKSLPPLPSSLEEIDVSNCFALGSVYNISNLESLTLLNLTNCEEVLDVPGLECLESLTRLYMSGCRACSLSVKRRLSKVCLRNMRNLSIPGSHIPDWFSQQTVNYHEHKNLAIKAVIIFAIVSVDHLIPDDLRDEIPVLPAVQVKMFNVNELKCCNTLDLQGVPKTDEDQIHMCRYPDCHPLVSRLKDGYKLEVTTPHPPIIQGVQLKKCGVHLVLENDDDFEGNEELLDWSHQSISAKLAKFFNSIEDDGVAC